MGIMNFLNKAYEKYQEYAPKIIELGEEAKGYKMEYMHLSDKDLVGELNNPKNNASKRTAIHMLLKDRGIEKDSDGVWRRQ